MPITLVMGIAFSFTSGPARTLIIYATGYAENRSTDVEPVRMRRVLFQCRLTMARSRSLTTVVFGKIARASVETTAPE